ncbi:transcription repressor OFP8-like [Zingiber officinale]|uniref:transcription repressor OFP8-like n=1 Tax=Zingiber officinale TaxID=94328 RepID=UPI001C4AF556|nr:transcription repressor OFP8-like [Zingiber officinale]
MHHKIQAFCGFSLASPPATGKDRIFFVFTMASGMRKFLLRHPVVVEAGCGCRRPKLPSFFSCSTKSKPQSDGGFLSPSTTTSHWGTSSFTATTAGDSSSTSRCNLSPERPKETAAAEGGRRKPRRKKSKRAAAPRKGVVDGSVAVVKDSSDPFLDFRDSMLQMIVEMEIYAWEDLRDLLHRFLALNAPRHHHLILRAFAEIWGGLFSSTTSPSTPSSSAFHRRRR